MAEREEIEAMWERIKALEEKSLNVAWNVAAFEVQFTHNWVLTTLGIWKPAEVDAYIKYMKPKTEAAQKAAMNAGSVGEAFDIAAKFSDDCLAYLKSQLGSKE